MSKRVYDFVLAVVGVLVLSPLLLLLALVVKCSDGGPIFFRQSRVGRGGCPFNMLKFRSMIVGADKRGLQVTQAGDPRITRVGRWLRKSKLDELPQLFNVLAGEMSLVGPRPEVPRYVALYTAEQRRVLELQPGITDPASLQFRDEEELLKQASDVEAFYIAHCLPEKLRVNLAYAARANRLTDTGVLLRTVFTCARPAASAPRA